MPLSTAGLAPPSMLAVSGSPECFQRFSPVFAFNTKISLATIYNTVHAFKKKGYLKEIALDGNKTYYDTNTSSHHHFYDEENEKLIDINNSKMHVSNIPNAPIHKSIKGVEVLVRLANDNYNQK